MTVCEALATKEELKQLKDELQELRDQLNEVFGEDENGIAQKIFEIGSTTSDAKDTAELAIWGLTKLRASNALVDIKQAVAGFIPGARNLSKKESQWVKVAGSGKTSGMINLDKVSTVAGKGSVASKLNSRLGGGSLGGLSLLSDLIQLKGTMAINVATVNILDKRIEAESRGLGLQIDAVNNGMLKLYDKNQGDITVIKNYLDVVNNNIEINKTNNFNNTQELEKLKQDNENLEIDLSKAETSIQNLKNKNVEIRSEIDEFKSDLDEFEDEFEKTTTELTQSLDSLEKQIEDLVRIVEDIRSQIKKINEEIDLIKVRLSELENRVTKAEEDIEILRNDLTTLEDDLRKEVKLVDTRSKSNEADIILLFKKLSRQRFEAIEIKEELPEDEGIEEVDSAEVAELKKYINEKVTALLDTQFTDKIEPAVKVVENVVNHKSYGLQKIQQSATKAWESTQNDKAMSATNLAFSIHNSLMLSNNLANTIKEASNLDFSLFQLKDKDGELYGTNEAVRSKTQSILSTLVNSEQYTALTARTAKTNRIYQTGINLLNTTYSLFDSARTTAELTAENTGKIGNALRESCAVYEDAYEEFLEEVKPQNTSMRALGKLKDNPANLENVFSSIDRVASEVIDFQEVASQLRTEKTLLVQEIDQTIKAELELKQKKLLENTTTIDISEDAFVSSSEVTQR